MLRSLARAGIVAALETALYPWTATLSLAMSAYVALVPLDSDPVVARMLADLDSEPVEQAA